MLTNVQDLAAATEPVSSQGVVAIDWSSYTEGMRQAGLQPEDAVAGSWAHISQANVEALVDGPAFLVVHPLGVFASAGKRKMMSKSVKWDAVLFSRCRAVGATEYEDDRGLGKFAIEFAGAGNVLLGRAQWAWKAKRFRDNREHVMAVAEERDRILTVVQQFV
jgi:hypothetical protein